MFRSRILAAFFRLVQMPAFDYRRAAAAMLVLVMAGCGRQDGLTRIEIEGAVSLEAKMLKAGVIRFVPIEGTKGPIAVAAISDGFYELPKHAGPIPGKYRVEIESTDLGEVSKDDEVAYVEYLKTHGGKAPPNPVHAAYHEKSQLMVEVTNGGDRKFDFLLSSDGK